MISNVLRHLGGIEFYGLVSLGLFFVFFLGMLVWAFRLKGSRLRDIAQLPLNSESDDGTSRKDLHE